MFIKIKSPLPSAYFPKERIICHQNIGDNLGSAICMPPSLHRKGFPYDWISMPGLHYIALDTTQVFYQVGVSHVKEATVLKNSAKISWKVKQEWHPQTYTCFIFASSLRVWSSFLKSFLFPTRMTGTFGQKCFTSGVHFSGMFSEKKSYTMKKVLALSQAHRRSNTLRRDSREWSPNMKEESCSFEIQT